MEWIDRLLEVLGDIRGELRELRGVRVELKEIKEELRKERRDRERGTVQAEQEEKEEEGRVAGTGESTSKKEREEEKERADAMRAEEDRRKKDERGEKSASSVTKKREGVEREVVSRKEDGRGFTEGAAGSVGRMTEGEVRVTIGKTKGGGPGGERGAKIREFVEREVRKRMERKGMGKNRRDTDGYGGKSEDRGSWWEEGRSETESEDKRGEGGETEREEDEGWEGRRRRGGEVEGEEKNRGENEREERERIWKSEKRADRDGERRERLSKGREDRNKEEERRRSERRKRSIVWKGVEGADPDERRKAVEVIVRTELGRKAVVRSVEERKGEEGVVLIMELGDEEDKEDLLDGKWEIGNRWQVRLEEDLTREERKMRWRITDKAVRERKKGKKVRTTNRRIWIEGREWKWDEEDDDWYRI